jgi:iron complex transport system ATP-binding protein
MGNLILELDRVHFRYGGAQDDAIRGVSLGVAGGELLGVVGPNGSGKTTLLRLLLGTVHPHSGAARVQGRPLESWSRRALARTVGVVVQREEPAFPLRVEQTIALGRYPHLGAMTSLTKSDRDIVERSIERCDVGHLRTRWVSTLSGGEWQRVRIARALAQEPGALVLDEATASLDVRHEMEILELLSELVREEGLAGLLVTHHVNLAARFVDRMMILDRGEAPASGPPGEVLTRPILERVFQWPVHVETRSGVPQFVPLRRGEDSDALPRAE